MAGLPSEVIDGKDEAESAGAPVLGTLSMPRISQQPTGQVAAPFVLRMAELFQL